MSEVASAATTSKPIMCVNEIDGSQTDCPGKRYLVVHPDMSTEVLCGSCIEANADSDYFAVGVHVYRIGNDVTNHFF